MRSRYCSEECRKAAKTLLRKIKNKPLPTCTICGQPFKRQSSRQHLCSNSCRTVFAESYAQSYRDENGDRLAALARGHYWKVKQADPDRIKKKNRDYLAANREKLNAKRRTEHSRRIARERLKRKIDADPARRLYRRMSANVFHALRDGKAGRGWESLIGYTLEDLKRHLERQFLPGMTWQNWGKGQHCWHIDHIVPKAAFRLTGEPDEEFCACWALTNLRPLWQPINQRKSSQRILLV